MKKIFITNKSISFEIGTEKITKRQKEIILSFRNQQENAYISKSKNKEDNKEIIKIENANTIIIPHNNYISNMIVKEANENYISFFKNTCLFSLYVQIEKYFDSLLCKNYFERGYLFDFIQAIDKLLSYIPIKKGITVINDGYLSQYSHFFAFFESLDIDSKAEIRKQFPQLTQKYKNWVRNNKVNNQYEDLISKGENFVNRIYSEIQVLIADKKINFFSPSSLEEEIKKDNFATWAHKEALTNKKYQKSINTAEVITARWLVNVIYEKMILLDFSVLEKFFMNYVLSYIHHPEYYEEGRKK